MTTQVNVRMDETVKQQAEELLFGLGLSMSAAVNLFVRAVIREQGLPFEVKRSTRDLSAQEIAMIDKALKKSEEDIAQGKTDDARSYIKDKISDLGAMTNV